MEERLNFSHAHGRIISAQLGAYIWYVPCTDLPHLCLQLQCEQQVQEEVKASGSQPALASLLEWFRPVPIQRHRLMWILVLVLMQQQELTLLSAELQLA